MTPEIWAGLATVAGVLIRHYFPQLKNWLPARPGDPASPPPLPGVAPPPSPPPAQPAGDRPIVAAYRWCQDAQLGLVDVTEQDRRALRALKPMVDALAQEAKP